MRKIISILLLITISALFGGNICAIEDTDFILIEGGEYEIGATDKNAKAEEKPLHTVNLNSYMICKYEVSQELWEEIMGVNPSKFPGESMPVDNISWYQAVEFCNKLSEVKGLKPVYTIDDTKKDPNNNNASDNLKKIVTADWSANGYRLPTEAEWEVAAKGAGLSKKYLYSGSSNIDEVGWYMKNSNKKTAKIGTKKPNELGIYDMTGNVTEWCWDWFDTKYFSISEKDNPKGPVIGENKVCKGGSWNRPDSFNTNTSRAGMNLWFSSWINGMRLCRSVVK